MLCLVSCASPSTNLTLTKAVSATAAALRQAEIEAKNAHTTYGLRPAEVTLTLHIDEQQSNASDLTVSAPIKALTLGGTFSITQTRERENTIVLKFTRNGEPPQD
jgi:hypothetical protein